VAAAGSTAEGSPEGASLAGASELQQAENPKIIRERYIIKKNYKTSIVR